MGSVSASSSPEPPPRKLPRGSWIRPSGMLHAASTSAKEGALMPKDVAEAILFVLSLPPRANVSQLMIRPTIDATPHLSGAA